MSAATIQQLWTLLLPLIVFIVSYIIQQEKWSAQLNGLIGWQYNRRQCRGCILHCPAI